MEWNEQQLGAIRAVESWFKSGGGPVFRLFGYAGTGKTTLAIEFAKRARASGARNVHFAAFTAKAASVMEQKGCWGATTIHRLIYLPRIKGAATLRALMERREQLETALKDAIEPTDLKRMTTQLSEVQRKIRREENGLKQPAWNLNLDSVLHGADLLIVDEVSMVGREMAEHLLSFDVPLLVLGDPGQLPPVADTGYFSSDRPDILLDEVHRQAQGSPILALAHKARMGEPLPLGEHVVPKGKLKVADLMKYDQVLVGTNKSRRNVNQRIREAMGREGPIPVPGDRLVCLKNNPDVGVHNGSLWHVLEATPYHDVIALELESVEGGQMVSCAAHRCLFEGKEPSHWAWNDACSFDFGYALTVHKAQGSQWDRVVILDESKVFREAARKWLYTGITRAAKDVVIIKTRK